MIASQFHPLAVDSGSRSPGARCPAFRGTQASSGWRRYVGLDAGFTVQAQSANISGDGPTSSCRSPDSSPPRTLPLPFNRRLSVVGQVTNLFNGRYYVRRPG